MICCHFLAGSVVCWHAHHKGALRLNWNSLNYISLSRIQQKSNVCWNQTFHNRPKIPVPIFTTSALAPKALLQLGEWLNAASGERRDTTGCGGWSFPFPLKTQEAKHCETDFPVSTLVTSALMTRPLDKAVTATSALEGDRTPSDTLNLIVFQMPKLRYCGHACPLKKNCVQWEKRAACYWLSFQN